VHFAAGKIPSGGKSPQNVYIVYQPRSRPKIVQSLVGSHVRPWPWHGPRNVGLGLGLGLGLEGCGLGLEGCGLGLDLGFLPWP